jgi:hypothetical protein
MSTIITRAGKGSALTWTEGDANITNLNNDKIEDIVEDTTPQLGGNLDVNGNAIVSVSNGNIAITPNGTGSVILDGLNWPQADGTANYVLKTNGSGQLSWVAQPTAFDPTAPGAIGAGTAAAGTFTALTATTSATLKGITEGALYDLGTTGGTIAPNAANGNVQKITLNSALTINAFTSPVAGQSITLIIYGGTAYTAITSTMKFAGGVKTLTATAGCIDILSIYYDGTNYFASLGKGFA